MDSGNVNFSQELVDNWVKDWVGVSIMNTEDYDKGPSVLGLYFLNVDSAKRAYLFMMEWKAQIMEEKKFCLSIVKENEQEYSFYFYKESRSEFVKGKFSENLDAKELKDFINKDANRTFVVIARYPDADNNIVDNPISHKFLTIEGFKYFERSEVKVNSIEDN